MTYIEKVREQHDKLKNHRFRDGKSIHSASKREVDDFITLAYDFLGNYALMAMGIKDQPYLEEKSFRSELYLPREERERNEFRQGFNAYAAHDARIMVLYMRYYYDSINFGEFAERILAAFDCYLMQVHEFLERGQVTFAYKTDMSKTKLKRIELYRLDLRDKKDFSGIKPELCMVITVPE